MPINHKMVKCTGNHALNLRTLNINAHLYVLICMYIVFFSKYAIE